MQMKPSNLLKKMVLKKKAEQPNGTVDEGLHLELEKQVCKTKYQQVKRTDTNFKILRFIGES